MINLITTTDITSEGKIITSHLEVSGADSGFPTDIFIYTNTGTEELGEFQGTCNLQEYRRLKTWTGDVVPIFANKYLKHNVARRVWPVDKAFDPETDELYNAVKQFKIEYLNGSNTSVSLPV